MHVLVTAASKHGSTAEIAQWIGDALQGEGVEAVVLEPERVTSVAGYDAVVLGSGVYAGRWLGPAKSFATRFSNELQHGRTWIFSSGPLGDPLKPDETPADVPEMLTLTGARDHRLFPGLIDKSKLGLAEKAILAVVKAPPGDFRQRDDIVEWGRGIAWTVAEEIGGVTASLD